MRRSRIFLSALVVVLTVAASGCSLLGGDGNVFDLAVGDCFDDGPDDGAEVSDVPVVDCSEPHDNEVFHTFEVEGEEFPGDEALLARAEEQCIPAFADYVGTDDASSSLDVFPITPTEGSWSQGDREVVCVLYDLELDKLEGSVQDAAL